jgi:hypothetical protein
MVQERSETVLGLYYVLGAVYRAHHFVPFGDSRAFIHFVASA